MSVVTRYQTELLIRLGNSGSGRACTAWVARYSTATKRAYANLRILETRGLVACDRGGYWPLWSITDAGSDFIAMAGRVAA